MIEQVTPTPTEILIWLAVIAVTIASIIGCVRCRGPLRFVTGCVAGLLVICWVMGAIGASSRPSKYKPFYVSKRRAQ